MSPRRVSAAVTASAMAILTAGCLGSDESVAEPSISDYRAEMVGICSTAQERLDALPAPPQQISDEDFAVEVSRAIRDEAADAAALRPPADVRADHLSFVENTEDQATAWSELSAAIAASEAGSGGDEVGRLRTEILELSLGRNDLAAEMGIDGCRRGG